MWALTAAILVTWHGVILSVPHRHIDDGVPQEELACSASHSLSQTSHLHGAGIVLAPHSCLACIAGTSSAAAPGFGSLPTATTSISQPPVLPDVCRSQDFSCLPLLRGPPLIV